ncbi:MAG: hypothetical protein KDC98_08670, partial [Planctomycetes bacterium]|nr:hypothetical protein [Planctomycetota bacterium]
ELRAAGMVVWQTPEVVLELPGPVQGRVATLPDGRLLYGRSTADGTTDLVVYDPRQPGVSPEPAYGLNTEHNELAPAVTAAGEVFFTSDRPDGSGGYDLYRAMWSPRGFGRPEPLLLCNTAFDETDPAPAPDGDGFVFARIDPERRSSDGALWHCELAAGLEPRRLFAPVARRIAPVDRDPAFAADGGALWFVRRELGRTLQLCRASLLGGEFDEPATIGTAWGVANLRAPNPGDDGLSLGLLQPRRAADGADLWFESRAREVYPWWPGQRWIERILLGLFLTFALLLLLLVLGRRWTTLDLLAQCLLLSLLLHVLLGLWLMGIEISGALLEGRNEGGDLEVTVMAAVTTNSAVASEGQRMADIAAAVRFTPRPRALDAAAPSAAAERAGQREIEAGAGTYASEQRAAKTSLTAEVDDAAAVAATHAGADAPLDTAATALPPMTGSERAAAAAAEAHADQGKGMAFVLVTPGGAVQRASATSSALDAGAAPERALPGSRPVTVPMVELEGKGEAALVATRDAEADADHVSAASAADTAVSGPMNDAGRAAALATRVAN